ncbi:hypothetical protein F5051DRAFT_434201, partial [Lentinula edodes]
DINTSLTTNFSEGNNLDAYYLGMADAPILFDDFDGTGPQLKPLNKQRQLNPTTIQLISSSPTLYIHEYPLAVMIYPEAIHLSSLIQSYVPNQPVPLVQFTGENSAGPALLAAGNHRRASLGPFLDLQDPVNRPWATYKQAMEKLQHCSEEEDTAEFSKQVNLLQGKLRTVGIWGVKFYDYRSLMNDKAAGHTILFQISDNNAMPQKPETDEELFEKLVDFLRQAQSPDDFKGLLKTALALTNKAPKIRALLQNHSKVMASYALHTSLPSLRSVNFTLDSLAAAAPIKWAYLAPVLNHSLISLRFLFDSNLSLKDIPMSHFYPASQHSHGKSSLGPEEEDHLDAVYDSISQYQRFFGDFKSLYGDALMYWKPQGNFGKFISRFVTEVAEPAYSLTFGDNGGLKDWNGLYGTSTINDPFQEYMEENNLSFDKLLLPNHHQWDTLYSMYQAQVLKLFTQLTRDWKSQGLLLSSQEKAIINSLPVRFSFLCRHSPVPPASGLNLIATPILCPSVFHALAEQLDDLTPGLQMISHLFVPGVHLSLSKTNVGSDSEPNPIRTYQDAVVHTLAYNYKRSLATWKMDTEPLNYDAVLYYWYRLVDITLIFRHTLRCYANDIGKILQILKTPEPHPAYGGNHFVFRSHQEAFYHFMDALRKHVKKDASAAFKIPQNRVPPNPERFVDVIQLYDHTMKLDSPSQSLVELLPFLPWNYCLSNNKRHLDSKLFELTAELYIMDSHWKPLLQHRSLAHFLEQIPIHLAFGQVPLIAMQLWCSSIDPKDVVDDKRSAEQLQAGVTYPEASYLADRQSARSMALKETSTFLSNILKSALKPQNGGLVVMRHGSRKKIAVIDPTVHEAFLRFAHTMLAQTYHTASAALGLVDDIPTSIRFAQQMAAFITDNQDAIGDTLDTSHQATDQEIRLYNDTIYMEADRASDGLWVGTESFDIEEKAFLKTRAVDLAVGWKKKEVKTTKNYRKRARPSSDSEEEDSNEDTGMDVDDNDDVEDRGEASSKGPRTKKLRKS